MSTLSVVKPGLHTTIQDLGRWGLQSRGVPVAGPMDPYSHRLANALVGNSVEAATLEITLVGPELEFDDDRMVAVAGGEFDVTINGEMVPSNATPFPIRSGSRLAFGSRKFGSRAYIAVSGGIESPPVFGSRSTHVPSKMGGIEGRALVAGDRLPLGDPSRVRLKPVAFRRTLTDRLELTSRQDGKTCLRGRVRVLPGPQRDRFAAEALNLLQSAPYSVTSESNRMGYRLDGPRLPQIGTTEMISEATPVGSLQVPSSGQPILLMADRQTTGGYPKLATAISADIGIAGQLGPGDLLSFEIVTDREALDALVAKERALMAVEAGER